MSKSKKIAVVLSGCGNKDGSEITEAVAVIVALSQAGADLTFFAPNTNFAAKNFLTDEVTQENRNIMIESARITRGHIQDINSLVSRDFDGVVFPGGFGVALHLCTWALKGAGCDVNPDVEKVIQDFHREKKPIGAVCIAPALIARVLGQQGVTVTLGNDKETIQEIQKTGAHHETCPVEDFISDRDHKIVTTPAYMYGSAKPHQVFAGIQKMVNEFIEMA